MDDGDRYVTTGKSPGNLGAVASKKFGPLSEEPSVRDPLRFGFQQRLNPNPVQQPGD